MSSSRFTFTASSENEKSRLDHFLKTELKKFSRNQIQKWIRCGAVLCNGKISVPAHVIKQGEVVALDIPEEEIRVEPEPIPLDILYEDGSLMAINKPAGILTHPAPGKFHGTLVNALAHHLKGELQRKFPLRPGIVHRLDRDTSGVLVVAKNSSSMENLARQFRLRKVSKIYRAIAVGKMNARFGEIEGSIGADFRSRKMAVIPTGRFSRTDFKVLKSFPRHTYLEVYPKTGRTHQIRVHLSKIGYPILGDKLYGGSTGNVPRQMLHAYRITIRHPLTKRELCFTAPLPKDFILTLQGLKQRS